MDGNASDNPARPRLNRQAHPRGCPIPSKAASSAYRGLLENRFSKSAVCSSHLAPIPRPTPIRSITSIRRMAGHSMTPLVNRENPLLGFAAGTHAITLRLSLSPAFHQSGRLVIAAGPSTPFMQTSIAGWRMKPIAMHENGSSSGHTDNSGSSTGAATFSPQR
jgi:hypothetical protein